MVHPATFAGCWSPISNHNLVINLAAIGHELAAAGCHGGLWPKGRGGGLEYRPAAREDSLGIWVRIQCNTSTT